MIDEIKKAREAMRTAEESLYASQNRLRTKQSALSNANRLGKDGIDRAATLQKEIADLNEQIERGKSGLKVIKDNVADLVGEFVLPETPRQLIAKLDDSLPFLMFPVRIETRFMNSGNVRELWVRVYPDDIAVHTHEKELSRDDADSGVEYWIQRTLAASLDNQEEREQQEAERILESRRAVVDEGFRAQDPNRDDQRAGQRAHPAGEHGQRADPECPEQNRRREEELSRDEVRRRDHQKPERMGKGLNPLVGIEVGSVSVDEIPHHPKGDVGVVAKPVVGEEDVGEQ